MKIIKLKGIIRVVTGLHIGGGDDTMRIGGIDNQVIKDINTNRPYIPGSSLKGKMRSLLEWDIGVVNLKRLEDEVGKPLNSKHIGEWDEEKGEFKKFYDVAFEDKALLNRAKTLLKLFGDKEGKFQITRISIGDAFLTEEIKQKEQNNKIKLFEAKYENVIDRQTGTAQHPRQIERVPAGIEFEFEIRVKLLPNDNKDDFKEMIERGLRLIEDDYLGGNGSRGYGRVKFIIDKNKWEEQWRI